MYKDMIVYGFVFLVLLFLLQNANAIIQTHGTRKQSFYTIILFIWFICTICAVQQTNCKMCEHGEQKERASLRHSEFEREQKRDREIEKKTTIKNLQSSLSYCKFTGFRPKGEFRSDHGIIYVSITSNIQMESDCNIVY